MKKISTIILSLLFAAVFTLPVFASAATSPGVKPGNFFYFFDTSFEKIGLFFTFSPEKKARRALQYADERLAEIEGIAEEKDTNAVKTAISNYENNVALAAEKSKEVTDKVKAESLLTSIEDKTEKNQEVLSVVLTKVPEDAREAILRAISASKKGQEEAAKQIIALKGEVEKLKQEVEELKEKDEERENVIEELSKPKSEKPATQQKISAPASVAPTPKLEQAQTSSKTSIVTLPSGAVVETDANGNIFRYIKEAPVSVTTQTPTVSVTPPPAVPSTQTETLEIISVSVVPDVISARIEWQTNKPTTAKVFISGGGLSSKVYSSESGLSTRHVANITGLISNTSYSYEIESIAGEQVVKKEGSFSTKPDEYTISIQADKTSVPASGWHSINFKVSTLKNEQSQSNQTISVITPDSIQNKTSTGDFIYYPKTIGTHTVVFSWGGVTKSIDIKAVEYVKINSVIRDVVNSNCDPDCSAKPIWTGDGFYSEKSIGYFSLSDADEPFALESIEYDSDIIDPVLTVFIYASSAGTCNAGYSGKTWQWGSSCGKNYLNTKYFIKLRSSNGNQTMDMKKYIGLHTFTIKTIKVIEDVSGNYRFVSGLPVTFSFEVR